MRWWRSSGSRTMNAGTTSACRLPHQSRERPRGRRRLAEKRNEHRLARAWRSDRTERRPAGHRRSALSTARAAECLRRDIDAGALAHPGHQRVAGQEALRVMDQGYLITMHRVRRRHKLEISEVRAEHDDAACRVASLDLVPVVKALVGHAPDEPAMKKPGQADVLGAAAAQVHVRGAQDAPAFALAAVGKRDRQIVHPDRHVAAVKQVAEITAEHPERIQNEIRQQAERDAAWRASIGTAASPMRPSLSPASGRPLARRHRRTEASGASSRRERALAALRGRQKQPRGVRGISGAASVFIVARARPRSHRLCRSRLRALAITTRPESVTWKRCRSRSRS